MFDFNLAGQSRVEAYIEQAEEMKRSHFGWSEVTLIELARMIQSERQHQELVAALRESSEQS